MLHWLAALSTRRYDVVFVIFLHIFSLYASRRGHFAEGPSKNRETNSNEPVSTKSLSFISSFVQDKVVVKVIFIACCNDLHAKASLTFRKFVRSPRRREFRWILSIGGIASNDRLRQLNSKKLFFSSFLYHVGIFILSERTVLHNGFRDNTLIIAN